MSQREDKKFQSDHRVIFFATNNINKFKEARIVLVNYNVAVGMLRVKSLEIQSESLEEIAKASAEDAFKRCTLPIIVEDAGLFIDALGWISRTVCCVRVQDNWKSGNTQVDA